MNRLYLLRHAKAAPAQADGRDRDRPLAERGEQDMLAVAAWMTKRGLVPDLVLCSAAARTHQTLAALLPRLGSRLRVLYEEGLYLADAAALLARLRKLDADCRSALVIGHNPGLHELAAVLADGVTGPPARRLKDGMPTAGIAVFDVPVDWAALDRGTARLTHFVGPKDLPGKGG